MKERAAKIAAQLAIESSAGQGTGITVTVKNQNFPPR
jgi:signal transduction histidine kinase